MLAMLVLVSSMGFYVAHMVCGMSGEHKLAINQSVDRCSDSCERSEEDSVKRTCCDYDSYYFKEDVPATKTENKTARFATAFVFDPLSEALAALDCSEPCAVPPLEMPDVWPSVDRHILLQTFLI